MRIEQRIKGVPTIKDERGDVYVPREVVLLMLEPLLKASDELVELESYIEDRSPIVKAYLAVR